MQEPSDIPKLNTSDLNQLRGARWELDGEVLHVSTDGPGVSLQAIREGGEASLVPLLDEQQQTRWFLKLFMGDAPQRRRRAEWLIRQQMQQWLPELSGVPRQWIDTRVCGRPDGFEQDFAGYLAASAPGEPWNEFKLRIKESGRFISDDCRQRWVRQLVRATAVLEQHGLVHGDLSQSNIVVKGDSGELFLIDFDAFVADAAPAEVQRLTCGEGGAVGTEHYMPVDLEQRRASGDPGIAPYSDRRARDVLVLELLCYDASLAAEDPGSIWNWSEIEQRLRSAGLNHALPYFLRPEILSAAESERVSSLELAAALRIGRPATAISRPADSSAAESAEWSRCGQRVRDALWSLNVAQWILLGFAVPDFLQHRVGIRSLQNSDTGWWIAVLAGVVIIAVGGRQTSRIAFGEETPTWCQVGPFLIPVPAFQTNVESPTVRRTVVLMRLTLSTILLGGIMLLLGT